LCFERAKALIEINDFESFLKRFDDRDQRACMIAINGTTGGGLGDDTQRG